MENGAPHSLWPSFKLVQVGIGRRMTQLPAHGNNLPFVVKSVGQNMVEHQRRSADGAVSIREMKFRIRVELLTGQAR